MACWRGKSVSCLVNLVLNIATVREQCCKVSKETISKSRMMYFLLDFYGNISSIFSLKKLKLKGRCHLFVVSLRMATKHISIDGNGKIMVQVYSTYKCTETYASFTPRLKTRLKAV